MTKTRLWLLGGAFAVVVVLAAGWFLVVAPQRSQADALRVQTATELAATATVRQQISLARTQAKQLPAKQAELAKFGRQITSDPGLPSLIRALSDASDAAGTDLVSITPGPPTAYVGTTASAVLPSAAASPAAAPAATSGAVPRPAVAATSALRSISLALKLTGTYAELEQLMANLEGMQRVLLVSGFAVAPGAPLKPATAAAGGATAAGSGCTNESCSLGLTVTGQVFTTPALAPTPAGPR